MNPFEYRDGALFCEETKLESIAAQVRTPCYVYSAGAIRDRFLAYDQAFGSHPHQVCYAVKANSNLAVLKLLAAEGAGFDIVSGGELYRVLQAGGDPGKVVFSGAGKQDGEIRYALEQRIHSFNCESVDEAARLSQLASEAGAEASVALRVNPDVDASTHPYISTGLREHKFGIDIAAVELAYRAVGGLPNLRVDGVSCHIGSQLLDLNPVMDAVDKMLALVDRLRKHGFPIQTLDLGGGLGIAYKPGDHSPDIPAFVHAVCEKTSGRGLTVFIEPGRSITADAGVLLTRVLYRKTNGAKRFVIVDAAMNDLIRPALYQAHHEILPLVENPVNQITADLVGPVCETGDFFARARALPDLQPEELVAIGAAGAYGFVQSSNYNARPRAAEVLVEGATFRIVRERESYGDLVRGETP